MTDIYLSEVGFPQEPPPNKLVYRTKPWPHQVEALRWVLKRRGGGLLIPMRFGKSWVAIHFAAGLYHLEDVRRVLIVTVTSGLGVWEDQIATHCPIPYRVMDWHGQLLQRYRETGIRFRIPTDYLDFMVVNFPNVYSRQRLGDNSWVPVDNDILMGFNADAVIIDESHNIGDAGAEQSKFCRRLGKRGRFRMIMTGTMFERKPLAVFGQAKFYDDGATLGGSFTHYRRKICVMGGYGGYEVLRYKNLGWMIRRMKRWVFMQEAPRGVPPVTNILHFVLGAPQGKAYNEMATESMVEVGGEVVTAPNALARHLREYMIEGGWMKLPTGKYHRVGDAKLRLCEDRLAEYMAQGIQKAVIGCRFIPEMADAARAAKRAGYRVIMFHGKIPHGHERARRIKRFTKTKHPTVFISQIATGSQAIDLSAADVCLLYSLSESYLIHSQFIKRIEKYNETRTLMYDVLIGRGLVGELIWEALQMGKDLAELIVTRPDLVEKLTDRLGPPH